MTPPILEHIDAAAITEFLATVGNNSEVYSVTTAKLADTKARPTSASIMVIQLRSDDENKFRSIKCFLFSDDSLPLALHNQPVFN